MRKRQRFQNLRESSRVEHARSQQLLDAADELVGKEIETEVLDAISRLPEKQAVAVLMRIVQEEPYDAIAQAMGCSESTVRIHVSRGRARLSQWLSHLKAAAAEEPGNE
jgi:RNA polymerase sigma factor (sigma-70 family)